MGSVNRPLVQLLFITLLAFGSFSDIYSKQPEYVTSASCESCHSIEYKLWSKSHHSWAWRLPTKDNVLGDFDNALFEHEGFLYRLKEANGRYTITADSETGEAVSYLVHSVVGITPLQQYLVETAQGRLQALDLVWDTENRRWYHLYPDQDTSAGNGMHWTGSYKNWNARCAECHATDFRKNYDPLNDRYQSTQAEIGVGCEACHGPGEAHLIWAKSPDTFQPSLWKNVNKTGLTSVFTYGDAESEINLCAPCHSRRSPLGSDSPFPGATFDDHYRLALLRDNLYFPDGQIDDEVYVYGSFLQSKMHTRGVRCTHCHDPHSYQVRSSGNDLCTQCHNPGGNPGFPTLKKADYDTEAHHFHEPGSDGAACKQCHMPERNYMVVDPRSDHSFRVPRPDLSSKLQTPDPCTGCHKDKTSEWAAQEIKSRFPNGQSGQSHFGELFAAVDEGSLSTQTSEQLIELANNTTMSPIVRASALQRLTHLMSPNQADNLSVLLSDKSPLVRMAAIPLYRSVPQQQRIKALTPLLKDPMQSVRIETAKTLLDVSVGALSEQNSIDLRNAMSELQRSLMAKADFPESQLVIGGVALTLRNLSAATHAFQRAVQMDPQLVQAWLMLARIQAVQGDIDSVRVTLKKAIQENPENPQLKQLLEQLAPGKEVIQ